MTLKSDAKFEEKLVLGSKKGMRNFVNFHPTTQKIQKPHFDELFLHKVYEV